MINIKYSITDVKELQRGKLPPNAIRIDTPNNINEMMKKASPIAVILCAIMFVAMLFKTVIFKEE